MDSKGRGLHSGIIFADLQGYSGIKSDDAFREVARHYRKYIRLHTNRENTFVTPKIAGDGILIFACTASHAVRLALLLRDHFRSFNWKRWKEPNHGMRIGIHFAEIEAEVKHAKIIDFFGQGVVAGSRIEPVATPGKAFCSKDIADAAAGKKDQNNVSFVPLGVRELAKGYGSMPLFEIMWDTEIESLESQGAVGITFPAPSPSLSGNLVGGKNEFMAIMKDMICWNQGHLITHFYLAGEKHRDMRLARKPLRPQLLRTLDEFLNERIKEALEENFEFARKLFAVRKGGDCVPRLAFKYHYVDPKTKKLLIGSFRVDKEASYRNSFPSEVKANTASDHVESLGVYYLNNNIPLSVARKEYKNPRLYRARACQYPMTGAANREFMAFRPIMGSWDQAWVDCWKPNPASRGKATPPAPRTCYKSTLVVPCTLKRNKLVDADEFWRRLTAKASLDELFRVRRAASPDDIERHIFAYFCMDYPEVGYFDEEFDVRIGYILADVLSLYFFMNQAYTVYSETVQGIESPSALPYR